MIRRLLIWPDAKLTQTSSPVMRETDLDKQALLHLVDDMRDTLTAHSDGVGLSAIQIGVPQRIFVYRTQYDFLSKGEIFSEDTWYVNPRIEEHLGKPILLDEGCLSLPGVTEKVARYNELKVSYETLETNERIYNTIIGLEAHVFQHELEHLDGRIFLRHLPTVKSNLITQKMLRFKKKNGRI